MNYTKEERNKIYKEFLDMLKSQWENVDKDYPYFKLSIDTFFKHNNPPLNIDYFPEIKSRAITVSELLEAIKETGEEQHDTYILLKEFAGVSVGTEIVWCEKRCCYCFWVPIKESKLGGLEKKPFILFQGVLKQFPCFFTKKAIKPPLGIKPKRIHDEERLEELTAAINRYKNTTFDIPQEWINERNELMLTLFSK